MAKNFSPAISVVIPMYNTERYIGECLDSIFAQTFQDFEVIVVDDCSTDNSYKVVKNYVERFKDKIQLLSTKTNSGGAWRPRNLGMRFARGEYLFLVDADDFITKTALEELYKLAKDFDADVVQCERYYRLEADGKISITSEPWAVSADKPTLESSNVVERLQAFSNRKIAWNAGGRFMRRDVVMEQNLEFLQLRTTEDLLFTETLLCVAKNWLKVPNVSYYYRKNENSVTQKLQSRDEKHFKAHFNLVIKGVEYLDKFLAELDFFKAHPEAKLLAFDALINLSLQWLLVFFGQVSPQILDKVMREELNLVSDAKALSAFLFGRMNRLHLQLIKTQQENQQLKSKIKILEEEKS